jgi:CRP/FNR family transcriptional regulator
MMSTVPPATPELFAHLPLFKRVSPEDRLRIASAARVVAFDRGATIFHEGDPSDQFITVLSGRVKICKHAQGDKEIILHLFGPGDPLGAVAVYDARAYPASAIALEPTTCLVIARQSFFTLLEQSPSLVRGLLSGLTLRLVQLTERLTELTGGHVEPRFARLFLKLGQQLGKPDRGGTFIALPLSRQELADLTGTTIETCIRIMSRWGKDDVLRTERDGFVILNRSTLDTLANS